jgi:hypothetical protein
MAKRVFLHVGTPESGTASLHAVLWQNADALKRDGLLLPARLGVHYAAAKAVTARSTRKRELDAEADQAWGRLARQSRRWEHDVLISHELFAPATREQARVAKHRLGRDTEVHLVVTARALNRQLPAAWREQVQSGMSLPFPTFVSRVRNREARGEWFWDVQDVIDILDRWAPHARPSHVHIVTAPAGSAEPGLLWSRFSSVLGVEPTSYDIEVPRGKASLGVVETELLRRVHAGRDGRFTGAHRRYWTRHLLAGEILEQRRGVPILLPDDARTWLEQRSHEIVAAIRERGYHVVGDLDELVWAEPAPQARSVASVTTDEMAEATAWTIARLQEQLVEREPRNPPPPVGPDDGFPGILELLEHIRAAETGETPRAPILRKLSAVDRLRKTVTSGLRRR